MHRPNYIILKDDMNSKKMKAPCTILLLAANVAVFFLLSFQGATEDGLFMSCCRNMVIVGDSMQLPQIVPSEVIPQAREYARQMQVHPSYDYVKHSIISSLKAIYSNLPTVLLREHYRCPRHNWLWKDFIRIWNEESSQARRGCVQ